jgi:hypothetical protein
MAIPNEVDFEFYFKRLAEFDSLLSITKSNTFRDMIQISRDSTESSIEKFVRLQKMTLVILTAQKIEAEKQFELCAVEINKASKDLDTGKFASVDEFSDLIESIAAYANRHKCVYELSLKVYTFAVSEFEKALLQLIYKPNNTSFHYESILEGLQYLAGKVFPGLDELRAITRIAPNIRKRGFAKTGDKLLLYIEQYADVLEKWNDLVDAYINILEQ